MAKQTAIVAIKTQKNASNALIPIECNNKNVNASNAVTKHPTQSDHPNNKLNAIADPTTSWISDPMIANSVNTHSANDVFGPYS